MARSFVRQHDRYVGGLDDAERAILISLMEQTRLILSPEVEPTGDALEDLVASIGLSLAGEDGRRDEGLGNAGPEALADRDPALDRLLPMAHRGDDQVAAEFRRLTEEGLRQRKSANLDTAIGCLRAARRGRVELDDSQAGAFLVALTDVRLLLGERMGMRTEEDAEALHRAMATISDDDPLGYAMAVYDFLTWVQETLTYALLGGEDDEAPGDSSDGGETAGPH